ncbi:uncharacterized protein K02A2.6-like [Ixodes scapularis]|uniref:uncharacterized protein K02A2.6-like n=1 Tax=Ixodes scapularis TaxID=6945 RepID=UPI001C393DAC|nr:uncharacterized protein K02A2.6-like [Ixodes scapularis]
MKPFFDRRLELTVHQGCLMYGMRVVVPPKLRNLLLEEIHLGHPGIVRSKELARSYIWWPSIDNDLEEQVKACQECYQQRNEPVPAPLHPWAWPTSPWQRVHLDFAGPVKGKMFLVAVDAHSKWPEVYVMEKTTSQHTIQRLQDLFCRFGVPEAIVTDNGPQFVSTEFKSFIKNLGGRHILSAAYHPSTNGLAERFVQTLKSALRKGRPQDSLELTVQTFLLTYRNTPHTTTKETPASLFLGRRLRTRLDAIKPSVGGRVGHQQFVQTSQRKARTRIFSVNDNVLVRNYRGSQKWVPGTILKQSGPVSFQVRVMTARGIYIWRRHQDQMLHHRENSMQATSDGFLPDLRDPENCVDEPVVSEFATTPQRATDNPAVQQRYPTRHRRPRDRYDA